MNFASFIRRKPLHSAALWRTVLGSLLFLFAAHAFCFFNLTYSSGSVMLNLSSGRSAQIAGGQYLLPIYWRIRGSLSSPLFVGMLSALYLTLGNVVLVWLMQLTHPLSLFALCGVTTVNAAVLSICAASLHIADAVFLSMFLCTLACAFAVRVRFGTVPAALLLTAALALDPHACAYFAALTLIILLGDLLADCDKRAFVKGLIAMLLALACAAALYLLGYTLMCSRNGYDMQTGLLLFGGDLKAAWLAPLQALFAPLTAYSHANVIIRILLALLGAVCIVRCARTHGKGIALVLALGTLALPLASALSILSNQPPVQITPAYCLPDVFLVMLFTRLLPDHRLLRRAAAGACGVLLLGCIVFSNQVYLKKNLEFESTLSLMSRVVSRLESTEGYRPGATPVAIIGTPQDSVYSVERKGFEHLSALDAASTNFAIATVEDVTWYVWEVLGYPLNFVSTYELEQLQALEAVQSLPAFPSSDCCVFIGDTLVIRLS